MQALSNSEQHPLSLSIVLHLLPGILIGTVFFISAPFVQKLNLPAFVALGVADLVILVPFVYGLLFYQGFKKNGRLSLNGILHYRERIPWWQYLVFVPVVAVGSAIFPLLAPISDFIHDTLFAWWPAMFEISMDLRAYSQSTIVTALAFNFLVISLIAPITEEIYFRGYLLPRLSRFGFWAVPIHTTLFGLFHVWTPWMAVGRAVGVIPFAYVVQRKRNVYIGVIAHVLFNVLDVVTATLPVFNG